MPRGTIIRERMLIREAEKRNLSCDSRLITKNTLPPPAETRSAAVSKGQVIDWLIQPQTAVYVREYRFKLVALGI